MDSQVLYEEVTWIPRFTRGLKAYSLKEQTQGLYSRDWWSRPFVPVYF